MPHKLETHICQWGTTHETETNGIGQWRCQLSWSDGKQCTQSTSDPTSSTRAFCQVEVVTAHDILRRRYYFNEFADTHMIMGPSELVHVRRWAPPESPAKLLNPDAQWQQLMGIPIVVKPDMPPDTWRLVKNSDHSQVLHEGSLSAECPNRTTQDPMEQCYNCEMPFDVIKYRYLCPFCKTKNSCCF